MNTRMPKTTPIIIILKKMKLPHPIANGITCGNFSMKTANGPSSWHTYLTPGHKLRPVKRCRRESWKSWQKEKDWSASICTLKKSWVETSSESSRNSWMRNELAKFNLTQMLNHFRVRVFLLCFRKNLLKGGVSIWRIKSRTSFKSSLNFCKRKPLPFLNTWAIQRGTREACISRLSKRRLTKTRWVSRKPMRWS